MRFALRMITAYKMHSWLVSQREQFREILNNREHPYRLAPSILNFCMNANSHKNLIKAGKEIYNVF
jgi:hypothetical protein